MLTVFVLDVMYCVRVVQLMFILRFYSEDLNTS
jgi:hypothetical protein